MQTQSIKWSETFGISHKGWHSHMLCQSQSFIPLVRKFTKILTQTHNDKRILFRIQTFSILYKQKI